MTEIIDSAQITFKDEKTPVSQNFDDIYFSKEDGLAESDHVFLKGGNVAAFFAQHKNLVIGETGFGTGLNFLLSWRAWKESGSQAPLHYFALEGYPLTKDMLQQVFKDHSVLSPFSEQLVHHYPSLLKGFHHLRFEQGQVTLTLMFGQAHEVLSKLEGVMDVWYLDGFAPAKNPEMWQEAVFAEIGRLSKSGTRLTTFTAAGFVKRGLAAQGFDMTKRQGFGRKRESLIGVMRDQNERNQIPQRTPWYKRPASATRRGDRVAIMGGGIAGSMAAFCLSRAGFEVSLFEKEDSLGAGGSGNRVGIIEPRLILDRAGGGRFNHLSYLHALRFFDQLEEEGISVWKGKRGLFSVAQNQQDLDHQQALIKAGILPEEHMVFIEQARTKEITGLDLPHGGLFYRQSGCLEPAKLCHVLTKGLKVHLKTEIAALSQHDQVWQLKDRDEKTLFEADHVVVCSSGQTGVLDPFYKSDLRARRGQVSYVAASADSQQLERALTCGGYFLPDFGEGDHIIGATFDYGYEFDDPAYKILSDKSHDENLSKMSRFLPEWKGEAIGGRAGLRAMVADKRPVVGPVFDQKWYETAYQDLCHGPRKKNFPPAQYIDGLWVMNALASRGVQSAPLLCDLLVNYMKGTPFIAEREIVEALHPARFVVRRLKKGQG